MGTEDESAYPRRNLPERPERQKDLRWPSPLPQPFYPSEDVGKVLRLILKRLDAIEKRLENIEKTLLQRQ